MGLSYDEYGRGWLNVAFAVEQKSSGTFLLAIQRINDSANGYRVNVPKDIYFKWSPSTVEEILNSAKVMGSIEYAVLLENLVK